MPYWRLFYHLVWATKNREAIIGSTEERLIERSFRLTFDDLGLDARALGLMPDHVHLIVSIPPSIAVSEAVKRLKGASSRALNDAAMTLSNNLTFAWHREYGALSVGERALPLAIDYVLHQKEHHASGNLLGALERISDIKSLKGTSVG
jgi:putative transposase